MNISPQTALNNLISIYQNSKLTPEEHEIMKESIKVLVNLINEVTAQKANSEDKKK